MPGCQVIRVASKGGTGCDDSILEINVGGRRFDTTYETIRSVPGSYLERLFSERFREPRRDSEGRVFIDRDGDTFALVLDFLQRGQRLLMVPDGLTWLRLWDEADFYGLDALQEQLKEMAMDFGGIPLSMALRFCGPTDLVRAGYPCEPVLSMLANEGHGANDVGPGMRLDAMFEAGFDWRSFYGLKVRLSGERTERTSHDRCVLDPDDDESYGYIFDFNHSEYDAIEGHVFLVCASAPGWVKANADAVNNSRNQPRDAPGALRDEGTRRLNLERKCVYDKQTLLFVENVNSMISGGKQWPGQQRLYSYAARCLETA